MIKSSIIFLNKFMNFTNEEIASKIRVDSYGYMCFDKSLRIYVTNDVMNIVAEQHPKIQMLDLSDCAAIIDLKFLTKLPNLTHLYLTRCMKINDLAPINSLNNLTYLDVGGCINVMEKQIDELHVHKLSVWTHG